CPTCAQTTVTTVDALVSGQTSTYLKGSYSSTKKIKTYFEYKKDTSTNIISINVGGVGAQKDSWTKVNSSEQIHNANSYGNVSFHLSGLTIGTKYNFRLVAQTIEVAPDVPKTFYGSTLSFTTFGNNGTGLNFIPEISPLGAGEIYGIVNPGGIFGQVTTGTTGTGNGTTGNLTLGQTATPPTDAIVHSQEGIETVFARQIIANKSLAKRYGYVEGQNITAFAWDLADLFAKIFGYIGYNGKEIRVSLPDIAAYQLAVVNNVLTVYEYFSFKIVNIQSMTEVLRNNYDYEYYFNKK
ncbi:MAG: hypothetical protein WAV10_04160, partial [Minisyncoccia bacterium]